MAWPNPFRRRDSQTRTCWGYTFQLTDEHLTAEGSRPLKFSYDKLGEQCLNILDKVDPPSMIEKVVPKAESQDLQKTGRSKPKRDLYQSLKSHVDDHPKLQELWTQLHTVPEWVDWDQVQWPVSL
jgi:hypothetical protein